MFIVDHFHASNGGKTPPREDVLIFMFPSQTKCKVFTEIRRLKWKAILVVSAACSQCAPRSCVFSQSSDREHIRFHNRLAIKRMETKWFMYFIETTTIVPQISMKMSQKKICAMWVLLQSAPQSCGHCIHQGMSQSCWWSFNESLWWTRGQCLKATHASLSGPFYLSLMWFIFSILCFGLMKTTKNPLRDCYRLATFTPNIMGKIEDMPYPYICVLIYAKSSSGTCILRRDNTIQFINQLWL